MATGFMAINKFGVVGRRGPSMAENTDGHGLFVGSAVFSMARIPYPSALSANRGIGPVRIGRAELVRVPTVRALSANRGANSFFAYITCRNIGENPHG